MNAMNGPHNQHLPLHNMHQQPPYPHDMHRPSVEAGGFPTQVPQKQEISSPSAADLAKAGPSEDKKSPPKPAKTLNRVPRACNACRKQKMRCEGADNPPCRRCRHAGLDCLFEKPSREPTLTGEAGLERIRSLEAQVADIRTTQHSIHSTLLDLVSHLRTGSGLVGPGAPSPGFRLPQGQSPAAAAAPSPYGVHSPASSGGTTGPVPMPMIDPSLQQPQRPPTGPSPALPPLLGATNKRHSGSYSFPNQGQYGPHNLPPLASLHQQQPQSHHDTKHPPTRNQESPTRRVPSGGKNDNGKRTLPSSNVTSANSSDDEDNSELPASGLVAPWEVLRGLAEAAAERAAKENGDSEPPSRARSHSPLPIPPHFLSGHNGNNALNGDLRPSKRRKTYHSGGRHLAYPDVVTKKIITEQEARDLFEIFYRGCSTFLPVFDSQVDTYDALHERSPFAVDCICMVAARVKCGGGPQNEIFRRCLDEVQSISCATLFSPVSRQEAVQAMVLVSGWSDNGWLSGGHAVRMALELGMNKAWPRLLKRMKANKISTSQEERELVISARTWFCLYLFEHQMSYGVGRPAILRFDESIRDCRLFLGHPLSIKDDMRLVSTVELMVIREKVHGRLEHASGDDTYTILREADMDFRTWFEQWDQRFSQKFSDVAFYRQSLQVQYIFAELFHNATALRGLNQPNDVATMPPAQKQIAVRSIQIAKAGLEISLAPSEYRESLKYAVHYTHATATFGASLLIRLARLLPEDCDLHAIKKDVEELANVLEQTPAGRYARSLRYMLRRAGERRILPSSPTRPPQTELVHSNSQQQLPVEQQSHMPSSSSSSSSHQYYFQQVHAQMFPGGGQYPQWYGENMGIGGSDSLEMQAWANMELNAGAVMSGGMEAYMIPVGYDQQQEAVPQIW